MRYLLSSALLLASSISALEIDHRITRLEDQMQGVRVETVNGNYGANTASAYPSMNTWGTYATIEGLYLKFFEGGTDYAWTDREAPSGTPFQGALKYLNFDWRFAFRVTAGYQFDNPDWDLWAEYMRFQTEQSHTTHKSSDGELYSNVLNLDAISSYTKLKMRIAFNTTDLNMGRNYFLRKNVSVHPFIGLRGAWINQHESVPIANESTRSIFYNMKQKNDYGGLGIRSGSSIRWHLNPSWSLYGGLAGSLMWGQFNNYVKLSQTLSGTTSTVLDLNTDTRRILPNLSTDVGLTWEHIFSRARISFTLGYEFDYWWRQNQTVHIDARNIYDIELAQTYGYIRLSEDLGMQGLKFNFGFDY
jgi:hypothetical protein